MYNLTGRVRGLLNIDTQVMSRLLDANLEDAFAILGYHQHDQQASITCLAPGADAVHVVDRRGQIVAPLKSAHRDGIFTSLDVPVGLSDYRLLVKTGSVNEEREDPYRFPSLLSNDDAWLFSEGRHERAWQFLGAHETEHTGVSGVHFAVWAPNAKRVAVLGDFNVWDARTHVMRFHPGCGIWEMFVPGPTAGCCYSFDILSRDGTRLRKSDPYAQLMSGPADSAAVVVNSCFSWSDDEWLSLREQANHSTRAISVYEVHLGSWKRTRTGDWLSYAALADQLLDYVTQTGFTHIELMPVSEHPFTGSWGYQPLGLYAPTVRYGTTDELKLFIDKAHQRNIGILLDWVPAHFPMDEHGLGQFDGSALYEHEDPKRGIHPDWDTFIYNYGRAEVMNYLVSNAAYWIEEFHIDGLRMDAVASMLYLDYSREDGNWLPNDQGGGENLEAIGFLNRVNDMVRTRYPGVMTIAEESTDWPDVTAETGLGFDFKWNMGWMNDTLMYIARDAIHRKHHHNQMTFSLVYAYSEKYILPISHDEVVHGKASLLSKMPGDRWQQFANLRALLAYMWAHPGKKLLFMGCEIGQWDEWDHDAELHWHLLEHPEHRGIQQLVTDLNRQYVSRPALHEKDGDSDGFTWLDADNTAESVFAFQRRGGENQEPVIIVANLTPVVRGHYVLNVPAEGTYREILNTDSAVYGGSDTGNLGRVDSAIGKDGPALRLTLPPLAVIYLMRDLP